MKTKKQAVRARRLYVHPSRFDKKHELVAMRKHKFEAGTDGVDPIPVLVLPGAVHKLECARHAPPSQQGADRLREALGELADRWEKRAQELEEMLAEVEPEEVIRRTRYVSKKSVNNYCAEELRQLLALAAHQTNQQPEDRK